MLRQYLGFPIGHILDFQLFSFSVKFWDLMAQSSTLREFPGKFPGNSSSFKIYGDAADVPKGSLSKIQVGSLTQIPKIPNPRPPQLLLLLFFIPKSLTSRSFAVFFWEGRVSHHSGAFPVLFLELEKFLWLHPKLLFPAGLAPEPHPCSSTPSRREEGPALLLSAAFSCFSALSQSSALWLSLFFPFFFLFYFFFIVLGFVFLLLVIQRQRLVEKSCCGNGALGSFSSQDKTPGGFRRILSYPGFFREVGMGWKCFILEVLPNNSSPGMLIWR